jgi:succinyl-CoA synthetase beta subunit
MRLLEHEAKEILKKYGIEVPDSTLVLSKEANIMLEGTIMLKAQVPIGGRARAGGVIEAVNGEDAPEKIIHLFNTRVREYGVRRILAESKVDVSKEYFMAVTYDTVAKQPIAIFTLEGGIEVEELAQKSPQKVSQAHFSVRTALFPYRAREIVLAQGIRGKLLLKLSTVLSKLSQIFIDYDATIAEINPLALTSDDRLVALDCHIDIDDDALFRHPEVKDLVNDESRYEPARKNTVFETKAAQINNLDHRGVAGRMIEFDGNLGLIIGGGGASLTAFDAVKDHGGRPANYCEIGGNPSVLKVKELTKLILSKQGVEKIAVIMNVVSNTRVDIVARGIVKGILEAGREPSKTVAVFRIPGAWEAEGFKILSKYGISYKDRKTSIDEAARTAVETVKLSKE